MKQHPKRFHEEFKCSKCSRQFETSETHLQHEEAAHNEPEKFGCIECDYETFDEQNIENHLKLAHSPGEEVNFKCVSCAQGFKAKSSLIRHRINAHGKSKVKCRNKADKSCKWGDNNGEDCLYDHSDSETPNLTKKLECNSCEECFSYKSQFLKHRKSKHPETVPDCKSLKNGETCTFGPQCGFNHNTPKQSQGVPSNKVNDQTNNIIKNINTNNDNSNFWLAQRTNNPPNQMEEIKEMIQTMMKDINQLKEQQNLSNQK